MPLNQWDSRRHSTTFEQLTAIEIRRFWIDKVDRGSKGRKLICATILTLTIHSIRISREGAFPDRRDGWKMRVDKCRASARWREGRAGRIRSRGTKRMPRECNETAAACRFAIHARCTYERKRKREREREREKANRALNGRTREWDSIKSDVGVGAPWWTSCASYPPRSGGERARLSEPPRIGSVSRRSERTGKRDNNPLFSPPCLVSALSQRETPTPGGKSPRRGD